MPKKIDFWQLARDNYNKKGLLTTFFYTLQGGCRL